MFHCSALAGNIVYKRNHDFFKGKKIFSAPRIFMFLSTNRSKEVVEEDDEHQAFSREFDDCGHSVRPFFDYSTKKEYTYVLHNSEVLPTFVCFDLQDFFFT